MMVLNQQCSVVTMATIDVPGGYGLTTYGDGPGGTPNAGPGGPIG